MAFELFIADSNKETLKPSELLLVFKRIELNKQYASATQLLEYIVNELGDPDLTFDRFMKITNDYYN